MSQTDTQPAPHGDHGDHGETVATNQSGAATGRDHATGQRLDDQTRRTLAHLPIGQAIRARAQLTPCAPAVREKDRGIYRERTWSLYADDIRALGIALMERGVGPGDTVAIMGDPTYRWMVADAATISIGAISFGIYTTCSGEEIQHQITTAGAVVFVAENQEYVDKFLDVSDQCPTVRHIVVEDTRALFAYDDRRIEGINDLLTEGHGATSESRVAFDARLEATRSTDTALLVFTSGTTGQSKAAQISHRNFLVGGALQLAQVFPETTEPGDKRIIAHLSLAHAFERIVALYSPILTSLVVHIGEDLESLASTIYEVQPFMLHGVPRIWQKMAAKAITDIERSSWAKRRSYQLAMRVARAYRARTWTGEDPLLLRWAYRLAQLLVFTPMLRKFGLVKTRFALSGGTHIPPSVQKTWHYWGLNLLNALGMTEVGFIAFQRGRFPEPGPVGLPVPELEVKLDEDGELLYRGAGVFAGYLGLPERTEDAMQAEGWFRSGDIGEYLDDGNLVLRDRKKDIMVTAGGKNLTPSLIENAMKASPFISEFVLIADNRKFPSGLVEIDPETVGEWAKARGLLFTGFTSLTELPEVVDLVASEVEEHNQSLARVEQVKRFRILPKQLDPEEGDTTPTRKIKRRHFEEMFQDLIEDMYREEQAEISRLG